MKSGLCISSKRRLKDSICIYGSYHKVSTLIENNPLLLWHAIHPKKSHVDNGNKAISLVRPAYAILKKSVAKIAPAEVATVEAQFEMKKRLRKNANAMNALKKQLDSGDIARNNAKFRKIN
jgi:hypothetical protein